MGKVHGSLARAGKVRGQTPKVAKQDKKKKPRGRAHKRMQYNRRFVTAVVGFGKKRGPNDSSENILRLVSEKDTLRSLKTIHWVCTSCSSSLYKTRHCFVLVVLHHRTNLDIPMEKLRFAGMAMTPRRTRIEGVEEICISENLALNLEDIQLTINLGLVP
ncbi:hypothetical protein Q3G72_033436 [Acer saccharum]|nr:hypothetical protein Q3G72_033436 [Acer saccharum]